MSADTIDRLPPYSPQAEMAIIGCIFQDPNASLGMCIEKLRARGDEFYDLRNKVVYDTMLELHEEREPIDVITMQERLKAWGTLEQVGGVARLSEVTDMVPSAANLEHYLGIVTEKFTLRRMIHVCTDIVARTYEHQGDVDHFMDIVERDILRICEARVQPGDLNLQALVQQAIANFESALNNHGEVTGLATGYADLDHMTGGLRGGQMIVIAARPSVGKSSLMRNIIDHVAVTNHVPVGVFTLEMTGQEVVEAMICSRARVNIRSVRHGFVANRELPKLTASAAQVNGAPIHIDDQGGQSILQIRAKARRWHQQHGIRLLCIDYLQLANAIGGKRRFESRQLEVSEVSAGCKNLAKELNIPVVVLSQLNRTIERDKNRKPRLSDLRESGSIEQDADVVSFLYRPGKDEEDDGPEDDAEAIPVNLLIAKQRAGPTGDVNLTFMKPFTRFESASRVGDEDVPQHNQEPELPIEPQAQHNDP